MKFFDRLKRKADITPDFSHVNSIEKAAELAKRGELYPLYLLPLRFNGEESARNRLFVPQVTVELKERYDDMVESLLVEEKVNGYSCTPEYKGESVVPAKLTLTAKKDGEAMFSETIQIW